MTLGLVTFIRYSSYLSMARTLMHWMTPSRLRSMSHQNMAAPCSSVAQASISRTTGVRPPPTPKLRRRRVTRRSRACCWNIRRVSKRCDIYQYNSSIKYLNNLIPLCCISVPYSDFSFVTSLKGPAHKYLSPVPAGRPECHSGSDGCPASEKLPFKAGILTGKPEIG